MACVVRSRLVCALLLGWHESLIYRCVWMHARCRSGDDGAVALAEALATNVHITALDLYRNNVTSRGANALVGMLKAPEGRGSGRGVGGFGSKCNVVES